MRHASIRPQIRRRVFVVGRRSTRPTARCPFKVRSASATNPAWKRTPMASTTSPFATTQLVVASSRVRQSCDTSRLDTDGRACPVRPLGRWLRPGTYRCTYEFSSCEFVDARDLAGWRHRFPGIENSYICGDLKTDHARKEGCGGGFLGQEAPFTE